MASISAFFKKEVIASVGQFDEKLGLGAATIFQGGEDYDYPLRALDKGFVIYYTNMIEVFHPWDDVSWIENGRGSRMRAAVKWILQQPGVTAVIPGFRNVKQVEDTLASLEVPNFTEEEQSSLRDFYENEVAPNIRGKY